MRRVILALVFAAGCDATIDDVIPCGLELVGSCPAGQACIENECRAECSSDADCETCCLSAGGHDPEIPLTCAPATYCDAWSK